MTQTTVSLTNLDSRDPRARLKYWDREALTRHAYEYRQNLLLDRSHIARPLAWCPIPLNHALSDWYYQLWFFYEIRLKLLTTYGHDYDQGINELRRAA